MLESQPSRGCSCPKFGHFATDCTSPAVPVVLIQNYASTAVAGNALPPTQLVPGESLVYFISYRPQHLSMCISIHRVLRITTACETLISGPLAAPFLGPLGAARRGPRPGVLGGLGPPGHYPAGTPAHSGRSNTLGLALFRGGPLPTQEGLPKSRTYNLSRKQENETPRPPARPFFFFLRRPRGCGADHRD